MFTLGVSDHIMIAHSFADPFFGPAQRLHGATYGVELSVQTAALGPHHVVMDIGALRSILRQVLSTLDYMNLDEHAAFPNRTSTTERLAEYLAQCVAREIEKVPTDAAPPRPAKVNVLLRESPVAWASYELALGGSAGG
ncbi:MAG TPA: 6-carboxytetrahydropterin synthase [Polyangiaceae bacterium]|nr:6-carboxytetrahydropterin synthase [Polyangiaceae bacterium]